MKMPIITFTEFLGSGKTTLLNHAQRGPSSPRGLSRHLSLGTGLDDSPHRAGLGIEGEKPALETERMSERLEPVALAEQFRSSLDGRLNAPAARVDATARQQVEASS